MAGALEFLAGADVAGWPEGLQADCLRVLAVAESRQAAVHARVLAAFTVPGGGLAGDGHGSARVWLSWQTQATRRAAAGKVGWMRRLAGHPLIAAALADGTVSVSWAAQLADWSDRLPPQVRDDADGRFLAAAAAGASPDGDSRGWRRICAGTTPAPTTTTAGSVTGRCGSARRLTGRGGWRGI